MPSAIAIDINEARASLVEGPRLTTRQSAHSATAVIAVVGRYKSEPGAQGIANKHDKFLALLSTKNQPENSLPNDESEETYERRRQAENRLRSVRHSRYCDRYMASLRNGGTAGMYHNPEHFCATGGCWHGPSPSTFPGNQLWTFASGAASFDAARAEGRQPDVDPVAPHVTDHARTLDVLGNMLQAALAAGLTDLEVAVSAVDITELEPHNPEIFELQTLNTRVLDRVIGWVEAGWVARDHLHIVRRPFGTARNFGIMGCQSTPQFMVYDEE